MDFAHVVRVLLRRWLILLLGLGMAGGAAIAAYRASPRSYEATSQLMVLLPPTAANPDLETSPFLYLPDGLLSLARAVALIPTTPEFRADLAGRGYSSTYTVTLQAREPIVTFTVESDDAAASLRTRDELMRRFSSDLDRIQREEDVPRRQWARVRVLHASSTPAVSSGSALRAAAGVGVVGAALTLLVIALVERRTVRASGRSRRSLADPESSDAPPLPPEPDPDSAPDDTVSAEQGLPAR